MDRRRWRSYIRTRRELVVSDVNMILRHRHVPTLHHPPVTRNQAARNSQYLPSYLSIAITRNLLTANSCPLSSDSAKPRKTPICWFPQPETHSPSLSNTASTLALHALSRACVSCASNSAISPYPDHRRGAPQLRLLSARHYPTLVRTVQPCPTAI